ncbi:MAG TPA: cobalt-precorrin-6A reductase [Alphaproteobacteria bacterium]|nr:cobalt-precorrin-6A reductase [Alphaproteobacteria bacterium]
MRILILGGTEEARLLADQLVTMGHEVITSYAGKTSDPLLPRGEIRTGGFGGPRGLSDFMLNNGIERLVDATHPYSVQMATNAVEASKYTGIPLVRLIRPPWKEPQYAFWHHVQSAADAAAGLPKGARVLLTVGHKGLDVFLARSDCSFLVRSIEPPDKPLPPYARSLIARPPFFVGAETELLRSEGITHLITKNSGGVQTEAKLKAAQQLRLAVVMIARPPLPEAHEAPTVGRAIAALKLDRYG